MSSRDDESTPKLSANRADTGLGGFDYADDGYPNSGLIRILINLWELFVRRWNRFWGGIFGGIASFFRTFCQCRLWKWSAVFGIVGLLTPVFLLLQAIFSTPQMALASSKPSLPETTERLAPPPFDPVEDGMVRADSLRNRFPEYRVLESSADNGVLQVDVVRTSDPAAAGVEPFVAVWSQDELPDFVNYRENRFAVPDGWQRDRGPRDASATPVDPYVDRRGVRLAAGDLPPLVRPSDVPEAGGVSQSPSSASFEVRAEWPRGVQFGEPVTLRISARNAADVPVSAARVMLTVSPVERVTDTAPMAAVVSDTLVWSDGNWRPGERREYLVTVVPDDRGLRAAVQVETAASASAESRVVGGPTLERTLPDARFGGSELPIEPRPRVTPEPSGVPGGDGLFGDGWFGEIEEPEGGDGGLLPEDDDTLLPTEPTLGGGSPFDVPPAADGPTVEEFPELPPDDPTAGPTPDAGATRFQDNVPTEPLVGRPQTTLKLTISQRPSPEGKRAVEFRIANTGSATAENVRLLVTLPASLRHEFGPELELAAGRIQPGGLYKTQLTADVLTAGPASVAAAVEAANARTTESVISTEAQ